MKTPLSVLNKWLKIFDKNMDFLSESDDDLLDLNYKEKLLDMFYNSGITEEQIEETISIVSEEVALQTPSEKMEAMVNLLVRTSDFEGEEGAVGFSNNQFNQYFDSLLRLFPDICPDYLIKFCKKYDHFDFDKVVNDLVQTEYVKLEKDPLELWEHFKQLLPDADPIYLRNQARVFVTRPVEELETFIKEAFEKQDYPSKSEYLKRKECLEEVASYLTDFVVDDFLMKIPNPILVFQDPNRKTILASEQVDENDIEFALDFLYNHFIYLRKREIEKVFYNYDKHLIKTFNKLKSMPKAFRQPRQVIMEEKECRNIPLLQEMAFLKHKKLIKQHIKQKDEKYRVALEQAKVHGLLQTCACCFDDQLIPEECFFCNDGCIFCKDCVKLGAETVIGRGETVFPCLSDCRSEFSLSTLQMVLEKKVFHRLCQRRQMQEIKSANIDGLETCPFCDFSMIPVEGDKIFKCGNSECMKESCRECRHISHLPLRCSEIEYDEDVRMRTYIENKMTEALLRECWKCGKKYYKESGCNMMTCYCLAKMCYVCGQAVTDYSHFHANKCPLYTQNLKQFHLVRIVQGAQSAKDELGISRDPDKLKFDPTRDLANQVN